MPKSKKAPKSVNPLNVIGEILGRRTQLGFDPATYEFKCPYIQTTCKKRGKSVVGPYPVCSIWRGSGDEKDAAVDLIPVCPKRFYEVDFIADVIERCWPGSKPPKNPRVAPEVQMKGFGKVDFVIADVNDQGEVTQFLSVELQAIDITGSVINSYMAIIGAEAAHKSHSRGFNWDNVYKRYVTQLIRKGYFHHHWGTKIVAVIPEQVYQYIIGRASFLTSNDIKAPDSNIVFVTYALTADEAVAPNAYKPKLVRCVATSHSALQQAMMYAVAPKREEFAKCITRSLANEIKLADLIKSGELADEGLIIEGSGGEHLDDGGANPVPAS